jgi:polyphosphate kinase 2 (PPK2 family)
VPAFEQHLVENGIILIKVWLEVGKKEQEKRFAARIDDPLRQWKLSPMDVGSYTRWDEYSKARDAMLKATDTKHAPWYIARSNDKRKARLNILAHILDAVPHKKIKRAKVDLPQRPEHGRYDDQSGIKDRRFVAERY